MNKSKIMRASWCIESIRRRVRRMLRFRQRTSRFKEAEACPFRMTMMKAIRGNNKMEAWLISTILVLRRSAVLKRSAKIHWLRSWSDTQHTRIHGPGWLNWTRCTKGPHQCPSVIKNRILQSKKTQIFLRLTQKEWAQAFCDFRRCRLSKIKGRETIWHILARIINMVPRSLLDMVASSTAALSLWCPGITYHNWNFRNSNRAL